MAKRVLLAAIGIVLIAGGATYAIARNEVSRVVEALDETKAVKVAPKVLAPTSKGAPETLLLIGNDERTHTTTAPVLPHSNEMLLVRIDPSKPTISMLSIPRELQVTFTAPNGEVITNRINSAYTYGFEDGKGTSGGVKLMVETIKRVLGIGVINHVFVTNFKKFEHAVDEMGCVYMTVDKRYYHVNEPGGEQYFEINLQPGYQRLCGKQALEFVANRHESTSLIRDARDQRFLLEVKAEYGATLFENREKFERILGKAVETDLHGEETVLQLLELLVESAGKPVRQVPFNVNLLPTYDTASEQQIHESVQSFLNGTAPIRKPRLTTSTHTTSHSHHSRNVRVLLTPTTTSELEEARSQAPRLPFPLEYPRGRDSFGGAEPDTLRVYDIRDQHRHLHKIYTIVIDRGGLGQFYDVQGTSWTDPPLLSNPGQTVHVGSRTYELFYAGEQVRVIAWHENDAVYWIENTLTNNVSPQAMLAMAEQTLPVISVHSTPSSNTTATHVPSSVDLAPRAAATTSLESKIGALLGFVGLGVVALLSLFVLTRQRELNVLREQVTHALALEARQRPLLAGGGGGGGGGGGPYGGGPYATQQPGPTDIPTIKPPAPTDIPDTTPAPTTIYHARRGWRRGVMLIAAGIVAAALVALGAHLVQARFFSPPSTPAGSAVPVAVFNATSTPGAAHRIAARLRAGRVRVGEIGDISAILSPGIYVLYPPGAEAQAQRVARLLHGPTPAVKPIQPQVQKTVGRHHEIVVLLD
jgi:LCP family protein required for cell wall assembly